MDTNVQKSCEKPRRVMSTNRDNANTPTYERNMNTSTYERTYTNANNNANTRDNATASRHERNTNANTSRYDRSANTAIEIPKKHEWAEILETDSMRECGEIRESTRQQEEIADCDNRE